jgi:hypothetical protein
MKEHKCTNPEAYWCTQCDGAKEREIAAERDALKAELENMRDALREARMFATLRGCRKTPDCDHCDLVAHIDGLLGPSGG